MRPDRLGPDRCRGGVTVVAWPRRATRELPAKSSQYAFDCSSRPIDCEGKCERHVTDLIVFNDPAGNQLEVFAGSSLFAQQQWLTGDAIGIDR
jgi:hypothetical protein